MYQWRVLLVNVRCTFSLFNVIKLTMPRLSQGHYFKLLFAMVGERSWYFISRSKMLPINAIALLVIVLALLVLALLLDLVGSQIPSVDY